MTEYAIVVERNLKYYVHKLCSQSSCNVYHDAIAECDSRFDAQNIARLINQAESSRLASSDYDKDSRTVAGNPNLEGLEHTVSPPVVLQQ